MSGKAYDLEMVKLGLVTGSVMPSPVARPRTKVVLPAPTSPTSSIIMDDSILLAKLAPQSNISCSE